jgi:hypothetical protein
MKKRSAILMAAGLVVALVAGAVAMTIGFSGNGTAEAGSRAKRDPVVRTIRRTITVHKDAKATDQAVQVVQLSSSDPSTTSDSSGTESESDDSSESESESDDDSVEFEDESNDDSEDHSSDDSTQSGSEDEFEDD